MNFLFSFVRRQKLSPSPVLRTETAYSIPIDAIVIIKEVFPELTSGNGKPVGGILPLTTNAFITVWIPYTRVIPEASKNEKKSFAFAAIFIPRKISTAQTANNAKIPTKPSSSPIIDKIKSLSAKGKNRYFCRDLNNPVPNHPPFPSAYNDWIN